MSLSVSKTSATAHSYSITPNTGRNTKHFRSRSRTNTPGNGTDDVKDVDYYQAAKDEFIQIVGQTQSGRSVAARNTSAQIIAKSNSEKVNVQLLSNTIGASIASIYVNGVLYTNNTDIPGDPGADAEYEIIVNLSFSENAVATSKSVQVQFSDKSGHAASDSFVQSGAEPEISVSPSTVNVPAAGGSGIITVQANDDWTVAVVEPSEEN